MKRSEINAIMKDALKLFDEYKISLPPFAKWTPEEWKQKGEETQEIKVARAEVLGLCSEVAILWCRIGGLGCLYLCVTICLIG